MNNIISFLWLQSKRRFVSQGQGKKMPFLIMLLFVGAIGFQVSFVSRSTTWDMSIAGWVLTGVFILYTAFGLFSNRLPSQMADIIWLYGTATSFSKVVYSVLFFSVTWKALLWIISAIFGDVLIVLLSGEHINLLGRSIIFVGLFFIAEVWLMSVSCARTVKKMKRVYVSVFLLMLGIYSICLYHFFFLQHSSEIWEGIGRFISGVGVVFDTLSPLYVVVFIGIITVSFMTIAFTSSQVEMKESLVKEAEFWEEFQERQFGSGQIIQKPKTTWWGLQGLNGIWSFLWLELLLVKKYLFFHSIHTVMLSGVFYVVIFMYPEWFYLLFFLIVSAVMLSSYYSGIVRHSQSGTLHLFPGALWKKIIILELTNTVWLFILYCVSIAFMAVDNLVYWYVYGLGIYIWFMTIRLFAFTNTSRKDLKISLPQYYKSFFMALGLSGICLYGIHLLTAGWYTLMVVVCVGSLCWCLFYRFR
ncbi:sporulation killing factor system integral membrane protein [Bacillus atrophaeus]|uniref:sporulation killing factor system integral membrane protein n=1 Tax=Bacillus atrophaeus TaxID=1452 RepID=UPI00227F4209|nr:sporulation killing factor system integral membrane protein [Bacillus atrophaeus]MCY8518867.1 sporulation killing factor system integral membrane protein [Bacillus atrophaeus]MCY9112546.1 sporulation killing factor system integral membrane protein [Bacillus atrophaeus]